MGDKFHRVTPSTFVGFQITLLLLLQIANRSLMDDGTSSNPEEIYLLIYPIHLFVYMYLFLILSNYEILKFNEIEQSLEDLFIKLVSQ